MPGRIITLGRDQEPDAAGALAELRKGIALTNGSANDRETDVLAFFYVALALGVDYPQTAVAVRRFMDNVLGRDMAKLSADRARGMAAAAGDRAAR